MSCKLLGWHVDRLSECWRHVRPCRGTPELSGAEQRRGDEMFSLFAHESLAYSEFVSSGGSLTPYRLLSSVFLLCHRVKVDLQFLNSCAYAQSDQWQETPTTSTVMPTLIIRHF